MRPLKSSARITDKSIFFAQGGGWVVDNLLDFQGGEDRDRFLPIEHNGGGIENWLPFNCIWGRGKIIRILVSLMGGSGKNFYC